MSLAWYIRRLRSMSPAEIAHRIRELALKTRARRLTEGWERYASPGGVPRIAGLREAVERASPEVRDAIHKAAQSAIEGRYSALGRDWPRRWPGTPLSADLWRLDPVTGRLWPGADTFTFDINYRHERRFGDVKYVWEINRLQFLQPLAAEALLSRDPKALALIEETIASWHANNPPFRGIAWNSGIECALRAISLIVVASLAGDRLSNKTIVRIREILAAHAFWLRRFPSRFSSANNHLVAEAAGELLIAIAMPEVSRSFALETEARGVLEAEASRQILADGMGAEQSPTYGAFTAELLLLAAYAARGSDKPLSAAVDQRLGQFARFIGWIADASGGVPAIGDDDEGRVLSLAAHERAYAMSVARAISGYLGQAPAGIVSVTPHLRDAIFSAPPAATPPPSGLVTFSSGGISVVRETRAGRELILALDHGPLGYLSIAAHGHADALSLLVAVDGRPLLVDPGTYLYHSGGTWRDWFRGTAAHNTLSIDGTDQSEISGPFNWGRKAEARLDAFKDGATWQLRASHDGYVPKFGVRHERTVEAADGGFTVRDRLLGAETPLPVEIVFQLAADCAASRDGQVVTVTPASGAPVRIAFETPGEISLLRGGPERSGGWVSPAFGLKHPAWRLAWRGRIGSSGAVVRFVLA